jgi:hypothetical protein
VRSLGSQLKRGGQWLVRIPDWERLFTRIAPVLDARLECSEWHGLNKELVINLFRQAYRLRFHKGRLVTVDSLGFVNSSMGSDGGDLCVPPDAFVRLVFGYRSLDELWDAWPDIVVKPEICSLVEVLFPRMRSYLYTPYHYLGGVDQA